MLSQTPHLPRRTSPVWAAPVTAGYPRASLGRACLTLVPACVLIGVSLPAEAFEVNGGISVGGVMAGTAPHLAVTAHASISWRSGGGFSWGVREMISVLPPTRKDGAGVYEQTAGMIGYTSRAFAFSAGPSLSILYVPACGATLCGRLAAITPLGGHVQASWYFSERVGISAHATLDWIRGRSMVLPQNGLTTMVVAGLVYRWSQESNQ